MGYEEDPNRDENGEPLMDFDDLVSDGDSAGSPVQGDFLEDDVEEWGDAGRDRSPTPVFDEDKVGKPRKRLVKKGDAGTSDKGGGGFSRSELYDDDIFNAVEEDVDGDAREFVREDEGRKRKKLGKEGVKEKKKVSKGERRFGGSSSNSGGKGASGSRAGGGSRKDGFSGGKFSGREDGEVKEMWDTIAGGDSEDDQEGPRNLDDDNFIDDTGVEPAEGYGSDGPRSPGDAPQAEEGEEYDEVKELFKMGKKRKKSEKSPAEMALLVERVMAELEIVAEEDADLNRNGKPAINKLKKLPLLTEVLSKKQLQQEFIDHGVLTLLKNWLEPLPDGSLPNINIRAAVLQILANFPIDLEQYDRREQLKKSGLGKVIMFLSKSDEETTSNRKLAKELVDKWSRPIFNKSTRFEDMRNVEDDRAFRRPTPRRPVSNAGVESRDGDFDPDRPRDQRAGQSSSRLHASRPEATSMDFVVRPQSKIDPEEIRARAKQAVHDQRRMKMNKKLQQLKAPKKKQLQATRLSVEGRGMLKYL